MAKRKIIIGNWKMNPGSEKEAETLFKSLTKSVNGVTRAEVVVCPPSVYLKSLKKISKKIILGAQNAFWGDVGPYTGEVSGDMLYGMGARYVILGHSERRAMGETNESISKKLKSAIGAGLKPILCIGETERDKDHNYFNVVKTQLEECLNGVPKNLIQKIIVAYEPVWAISSTPNRRDANAADSFEMAIFIRKILSDICSTKVAQSMRVIYGGSVNEHDAFDFLKIGGVDGLLVGRASLSAKKFSEIIKIADNAIN